ncbi:MAG: HPr family phosphocarrier protein [Gammaproteobacteria bacterium]|nr:HPr family phosphocarrier protein [Gammaproteobacteria bacterium]
MIEDQATICNKLGLHARAAAKFVATASGFESEIEIEKDGKRVNGKSIMGVMMLAASKGTNITLFIEGHDAEDAMIKIKQLIDSRFGEDE